MAMRYASLSRSMSVLSKSIHHRQQYITKETHQTQQRTISSLLHNRIINNTPGFKTPQLRKDIDYAISQVREYDPAGFLPGFLLPSDGRTGYFAVRAFWVETGLRLAPLTPSSERSGRQTFASATVTPEERVKFWRQGIHALYNTATTGNQKDEQDDPDWQLIQSHPILRLLKFTLDRHDLSKNHFLQVLDGRQRDINVKQYLCMDSFIQHSQQSCGNLLNLTLECLGIHSGGNDTESSFRNPHVINSAAHEAALQIGICHGLTNGLRTAIPVVSNTGKIIIPQELCHKYDVRSPRFLLSALGQGDKKCREAFQMAVKDIVLVAREYLEQARQKKQTILEQPDGERAVMALLPGLTAETFLNRLELHEYNLSSKDLRQIGPLEHFLCASRVIRASRNNTF